MHYTVKKGQKLSNINLSIIPIFPKTAEHAASFVLEGLQAGVKF